MKAKLVHAQLWYDFTTGEVMFTPPQERRSGESLQCVTMSLEALSLVAPELEAACGVLEQHAKEANRLWEAFFTLASFAMRARGSRLVADFERGALGVEKVEEVER